jgi:hypothetical protein
VVLRGPNGNPEVRAYALFVQARARARSGRRAEARRLAEAARDEYRALGPGGAEGVAEVEAWLATR